MPLQRRTNAAPPGMCDMDRVIWEQQQRKAARPLPALGKKISDEFRDVICNGGTPVQDCMCGRTYFAGPNAYWEPGEYEKLLEKEKLDPKRFIHVSDMDAVSFGQIDGQIYVWHCEFCPHVKQLEEWMLNHRFIFAKFMKSRAAKISKTAASESELTEGLDNATQ